MEKCVKYISADITFAVAVPREWEGQAWIEHIPCVFEVKMPKGALSKEQSEMKLILENARNGWRYRVVRSVDEAIAELREMGVA